VHPKTSRTANEAARDNGGSAREPLQVTQKKIELGSGTMPCLLARALIPALFAPGYCAVAAVAAKEEEEEEVALEVVVQEEEA
jgi:hypothetical protein